MAATTNVDKRQLLQKRERRSVSLTQRPLLLFGTPRSPTDDVSMSSAASETDSASASEREKVKPAKSKSKKSKKSEAGDIEDATAAAQSAPLVLHSQSQPTSPRTMALAQRRRDAERSFREEVLDILDAQQEHLDRLATAVQTLAQHQAANNSGCGCVLL